MSRQKFPPGWDEDRVREVLAHYESQTEDEQFAEIEAAREVIEDHHDGRADRASSRGPSIDRAETQCLTASCCWGMGHEQLG